MCRGAVLRKGKSQLGHGCDLNVTYDPRTLRDEIDWTEPSRGERALAILGQA